MAYDTTALVASIKRRASVPTSQPTLSAQDFLDVANEELQGYVVPLILKERSGYFWTEADQALIPGQSQYRMPTRAVGSKLADVQIIDTLGNFRTVPQITVDQLSAVEFGCYVKGNLLCLWNNLQPLNAQWITLRMSYYQRPAALVYPTSAGVVSSVLGQVVTLTGTAPAGFTNGLPYDLVRGTPGFETLATDVTANVSGSTVTLSLAAPSDMKAGDYVCLSGQSPVPQAPAEFHPLLAQAAAVKVLQVICDFEALDRAVPILKEMERNALALVAQRIDDDPVQVVARGGLYRSLW